MTRRSVCALLSTGVMTHLIGQDPAWEAATRRGFAALDQELVHEAERNFSIALNQARSAKADDLMIAQCLDNLGRATELAGGKREQLYRQSLEIRERLLKPEDPEVARSLARVVSTAYNPVDHKARDPKEAEQMLDRAMKIARTEPQSMLMAEVSETLGVFRHCGYAGGNDYSKLQDQVEPLYRQALAIRENFNTGNDLALAQVLELNSVLLLETARADQAKPLSTRASEIRRRHIQDLSPADSRGAYRIGVGISPPTILAKSEPEYSDLARLLKWQGSVALILVVTETGAADSIRLARSVGLGLDERALLAVRDWRFRPGQKNGEPVKVLIGIQTNFQLL